VAVVAGAGAGLLAARLLLPGLPLVDVPDFAVPLDPVSSVLPALGSGLVLAAIVAVVAGRGRRLDAELTRPSTLREGQWQGVAR
jgi:prepilin signal peptidase PulO-like enzyme (type II secretory pathway)